MSLTRRDLLRASSFLAFATLQLPAAEVGKPLFFSASEYELLDALTELIIPADSHSPGAREAGVAQYIDRSVAEAFEPETKTSWRKGLACVDDLSKKQNGKAFLSASSGERAVVLKTMSLNEFQPKSDSEKFFGQLKKATAFAYYSSSIGIHQDMLYKGNVILEQFAGISVA